MNNNEAIFLRINSINLSGGDQTHSTTYTVHISIDPLEKETKLKIQGENILEYTSTICFSIPNNYKDDIFISISVYDVFLVKFATISLPLKWFPRNAVVSDIYPMRKCSQKYDDIKIDMDVHISSRGELPFTAKTGKLLVTPAWSGKEPGKGNNIRETDIKLQKELWSQKMRRESTNSLGADVALPDVPGVIIPKMPDIPGIPPIRGYSDKFYHFYRKPITNQENHH